MSKVAIVTDSTSCIPKDLLKKYDIHVINYHLIMEGKDYIDQVDITPEEFWKMHKDMKTIPTTGVPGPGEYAEVFKELAKSTNNIVCICISAALSAAYKSILDARKMVLEELPDLKIELVDSKNAATALGFVVLEAARAAEAGKSLDEVVKVAEGLVPRVKFSMALETLKYLIKGGRAPKTAVIGEFMNIKPLIGIVDETGLVVSLGKEKGKRKALQKLVDLVKDYADPNKPLHVSVNYTNNIEDAEELKGMVTSQYNCVEVLMCDLTPVMTTHTGPAVGLCYYS
jgi:DegV family protein with EDD domain